jgi:hypothetical protein
MRGNSLAVLILSGAACASVASDLISYIPRSALESFVAETLDLASFRNSFGPRRTAEQRRFSSFGMTPNRSANGIIQYEDADWIYRIEIGGRGDHNRDGIEDLKLCFEDRAKDGTYSTAQSLLVTRYSNDGLLVALNYEVDACGK